jgi:hypothetical protein
MRLVVRLATRTPVMLVNVNRSVAQQRGQDARYHFGDRPERFMGDDHRGGGDWWLV